MLNNFARALFARVFGPVATLLIRLGVSADAVTVVGTLGVCFGALFFFPRGHLFWGVMVITAFVFSDIVDGLIARRTGGSSTWGAFLDSSLDRFGDAAVFGGLVLYYAGPGHDEYGKVMALACLALGSIVSYLRAKAEGLGWQANVGVMERSDRLVSTLLATGFVGAGWLWDWGLLVVLTVVAVGSVWTIGQRIVMVRRQALATTSPEAPADA